MRRGGLDDAAQPGGGEARRRLDRDRVGAPEPRRTCGGAELLPQPGVRKHIEIPGQRASEIEVIVLDRCRPLAEACQIPEQSPAAGYRWDDRQIQLATVSPAHDGPPVARTGLERVPGPVERRVREDRRRRGPDPRARSDERRHRRRGDAPTCARAGDRSRSSLAPSRRPRHDPARARRRARRAAASPRAGLGARPARRRRQPWRSSQSTAVSTPRRGRSGRRHDGSTALRPRGAGPAIRRHTSRARPRASLSDGLGRHAC